MRDRWGRLLKDPTSADTGKPGLTPELLTLHNTNTDKEEARTTHVSLLDTIDGGTSRPVASRYVNFDDKNDKKDDWYDDDLDGSSEGEKVKEVEKARRLFNFYDHDHDHASHHYPRRQNESNKESNMYRSHPHPSTDHPHASRPFIPRPEVVHDEDARYLAAERHRAMIQLGLESEEDTQLSPPEEWTPRGSILQQRMDPTREAEASGGGWCCVGGRTPSQPSRADKNEVENEDEGEFRRPVAGALRQYDDEDENDACTIM